LALVQLGGYFDRHLDVLVSLSVPVQMRNAHPAQGEDLTALGSGWEGDFFRSVQRGDLYFFSIQRAYFIIDSHCPSPWRPASSKTLCAWPLPR